MKKTNRGGKRPHSGAKLKFGEPTKVVSVRVPKSKEKELKIKFIEHLKTLSV